MTQTALTVLTLLFASVTPAEATSVASCTRTLAVHGEENRHTDLGGSLVMWGELWSNQGFYDDLYMADCASGEALRARMASQGVTEAIPYDRRNDAGEALTTLLSGSMAFLNLDRAEAALTGVRVPVERLQLTDEPCACAVFYPEARGDKRPFAEQ